MIGKTAEIGGKGEDACEKNIRSNGHPKLKHAQTAGKRTCQPWQCKLPIEMGQELSRLKESKFLCYRGHPVTQMKIPQEKTWGGYCTEIHRCIPSFISRGKKVGWFKVKRKGGGTIKINLILDAAKG